MNLYSQKSGYMILLAGISVSNGLMDVWQQKFLECEKVGWFVVVNMMSNKLTFYNTHTQPSAI